jgi:predicted metal-dependent hydrolase
MPSSPNNPRIIRSQRKSFGLEITPNGQLIVRAPKSASDAQIQTIIAQKAAWIAKARARLAAQYPDRQPKAFSPGESFWYLGERYPLSLTDRQHPLLELDGTFHLARHTQDQAKQVFIAWYREETRHITRELITDYSKQFHIKVNRLRITSARTRWGSCSGKGNLNFTYRLCMAPLPVISYVVAHELAHLKVPNHSRAFWAEVAKMYPNYQQQRAWLKQNGYLLNLD